MLNPEYDTMNLERYPYNNSNDFQDYEFYSAGPKGRIKKIVMLQKSPILNRQFII